MIQPEHDPELLSKARPAHWVMRTSNLRESLRFLSDVFGMRVLRHEEYDQPCAITCNGAYETPWSKTMVGYGPEDEGYCLELTYNYGISSYDAGTGFAHIAVAVEGMDIALAAASSLGYAVQGDLITGPDGYQFRVVARQADRQEPFQYVAIRVANLQKAAEFYKVVMGMKELPEQFEMFGSQACTVGYGRAQVPLLLIEDKSSQDVRLEQWEGRNAIAVPGKALRAIYQQIVEGQLGGILHTLREFNELPAIRRKRGLPPMPCSPAPADYLRSLREDPSSAPAEGTLAVAIVTDPDGYEICLVSSETYDVAVAMAYDPSCEIDWGWRADAEAGVRTHSPQHMLACV